MNEGWLCPLGEHFYILDHLKVQTPGILIYNLHLYLQFSDLELEGRGSDQRIWKHGHLLPFPKESKELVNDIIFNSM